MSFNDKIYFIRLVRNILYWNKRPILASNYSYTAISLNCFLILYYINILLNIYFIIKFYNFQIIRERIYPHKSRDGYIWNSDPGALLTPTTFSDSVFDFPFEFAQCPPASPTTVASHSKPGCDKFISSGIPEFPKSRPLPRPLTSISSNSSNEKFTAVIYTQLSSPVVHLVRLWRHF
jgi:hypothetical protein